MKNLSNMIRLSVIFVIIFSATFNGVYSNYLSKKSDQLNYRDSLLYIYTNSSDLLIINIRNRECYKCKFEQVGQVISGFNSSVRIDTNYPNYHILITNVKNNKIYCSNLLTQPTYLGENGTYLLEIEIDFLNKSNTTCKLITLVEPDNIYVPLYVAVGILISLALVYVSGKYIIEKCKHKLSTTYANNQIVNSDFGGSSSLIDNDSSTRTIELPNKKSSRLRSIDVYRGIIIFLMIFANYGSGDYGFLDHAVWNGLNLADIIFPNFIFIMGISIPLSFKAMSIKNMNRINSQQEINIKKVIYRILKRSALLFLFGLVIGNSSAQHLNQLRIMGVLQRFAITYLVCALIELTYFYLNNYKYPDLNENNPNISWTSSKQLYISSKFQEIFLYKYQWIISLLFIVIWTLITFLLPIEGCKTGYIGMI
jgi:heparan-alpha-glucosaminide N-acetyltransferase